MAAVFVGGFAMRPGLMTRAAVGALLAAVMWGGRAAATAGPVGADDAAVIDAERVVTNENGVHAAPSGHVAVAALPAKAGPPRARPVLIAHAAPARLIRASSVRTAATPTKAAPRPIRLVSQRRLTIALPDALIGPPQDDDGDDAAAAPQPAFDPAPQITPQAVEQAALSPSPALATIAAPALPADAVEDVAQDAPTPPASVELAQADAVQPSEEASVYRRATSPDAPAEAAADPDGQPKLVMARDERAPEPGEGLRQHVAFPRRSAEAAAAFDGYMHAVAAIDAGFKSGPGVAQALRTASAYDPHQLEEGMVAYGAMAALQSPQFVYAVMDAAADPASRRALIDTLLADPESAARLPGARDAAALASAAVLREARPVVAAGQALKQAAYDVQHQGWSIAKATDQPGRLAAAKAASALRVAEAQGDMARLVSQVSQAGGAAGDDRTAVSPVTARSLALAALAILDGATGEEARLDPVVSEATSAECLKLSKLNLFQCLSVAGPEYEDVYCLAQHAVLDTGKCVAGAASPLEAVLDANPRMSRRADLR